MPGEMPLIGERFPEIEVITTHGPKKLPDDYEGKWFVLFSHPADFTPVCTTEFVAFAMRYNDFKKLNTELIGLSVDSVYSHIKWIEWIKDKFNVEIKFPIIADPQGKVAKRLGMIHKESETHTVRAVFIVDGKGIIRAILYYPLSMGRLIDEILRIVKGLQIVTRTGRALPANWPSNELIGDSVIVPPPSSVDEANKRENTYKCFDWWFCYEERKISSEEVDEVKNYLKRLFCK